MTTTLGVGPLATIPAVNYQGTPETLGYEINMTDAIADLPGAIVANPTSELTDVTRLPAVPVTLVDAPTCVSPYVTQIVRGSALTAGHTYQLLVTFEAGGLTVLCVVMVLICPI